LVLILRRCSAIAAAFVVATSVATGAGGQTTASIWDGVFTVEQARRGQTAYTGPCDRCHGYKLDGASDDPDMLPTPPAAGRKFLRAWEGRSLAALFEYTQQTMPANNPGFLTAQELVDVIAYMLLVSGAPGGDTELGTAPRDLARIVIERRRHDGS
jgi:mono/diheme cytochrome c family protein